ncbi:MAG: [Fe-Fe] hydrogenase large subunit C-terminal domain-containing protein [Bacteroidales bacterium]
MAINDDKCNGCTHCMTACPTRAIRVTGGKARIIPDKCVDCGECYRACPVSAIEVAQDDLGMIFKYPVRVILVPSVLIGQFSHKIAASRIYNALGEIGFTHVYHVESSVDLVLEAYRHYSESTAIRPLLSSFCPAIVRLIQVRFPALVDNIVRVNPPIDMTALYFREKLKASGHPVENIGIFYATPCAAKIAAVKSPVGEKDSVVNGVINMNFLYNKIQMLLQKPENGKTMPVTDELVNSRGIVWSLTRGESAHSKKRALAIDGIRNVTEILESVENDTLGVADFLELRACDEGCAGGILMTGNRFLTVERLRKLSSEYEKRPGDKFTAPGSDFMSLSGSCHLGGIEPRNIEKLDENLAEAVRKMERKRRMMCYLPGFDCAACGAPDCETLSEDIVQNKAAISHCIFLQQQMLKQKTLSIEKATLITEKIWGAERLEKNCNKPGAEDENN